MKSTDTTPVLAIDQRVAPEQEVLEMLRVLTVRGAAADRRCAQRKRADDKNRTLSECIGPAILEFDQGVAS
jgi:hypothetical protein